jgi:hypothetical protein
MDIKGRHKPRVPSESVKWVCQVKENGVIRIDDEFCPEFWLEFHLSNEDLKTLNQKTLGHEEGDQCNRPCDEEQCDGVITLSKPENCSCHIAHPCSSCESIKHFCPKCEWQE